jgi:hypothetical protein
MSGASRHTSDEQGGQTDTLYRKRPMAPPYIAAAAVLAVTTIAMPR